MLRDPEDDRVIDNRSEMTSAMPAAGTVRPAFTSSDLVAVTGGSGASAAIRTIIGRLQTTLTSMSPTPSTWPVRTSPRVTAPTPAGVPDRMMSPGISVNRLER